MPDISNLSVTLPYLLGALAFGYLLGSIPFGLIFAKMAGLGDIRNIGSGNIGATNVLRSGKKGVAAATLLADMLKGAVAVWIAFNWGLDAALMAGLGAFLGHCFPVWLKFKGGKGIATYVGVLLALTLPGLVIFAVMWLGVAALTRYSSLAALVATASVPLGLFYFGQHKIALLFVILSVLAWIFHRANISRLLSGTESKIGSKG